MTIEPSAKLRPKVGHEVHVPKTAEIIARTIRRQIVQGKLKEGDPLPSEASLMEQFGVSRPTLREAIRVLESESLITVRRGSNGGGQVREPDGALAARYAALVLEYRSTTLEDVYRARTEIESGCAGLAAVNRTEADLEELQRIYNEIDEAPDVATRMGLHAAFDNAIVAAAHNETLQLLSGIIRTIIDRSTLDVVLATAHRPATRKSYEDAHLAHRKLIDHLRARDAAAAAGHWRRHLELAQQFVLSRGGISGKSVLDLLH